MRNYLLSGRRKRGTVKDLTNREGGKDGDDGDDRGDGQSDREASGLG